MIHKKKHRTSFNDKTKETTYATWCGEEVDFFSSSGRWDKTSCVDCFMGKAKTKQPSKVRYTRSTQLYSKGVKKL